MLHVQSNQQQEQESSEGSCYNGCYMYKAINNRNKRVVKEVVIMAATCTKQSTTGTRE